MLVGREAEIAKIEGLMLSPRSEFVVVYGRRRVGKTFLIREAFSKLFTFQHTGMANSNTSEQLGKFAISLRDAGYGETEPIKNWGDAFDALKKVIDGSAQTKKFVFLDELPWMDTKKSGFLQEFEHFWNAWCAVRTDIVLVVCGSATSWITDNVINNRGGLYNRVTCQIYLRPFTLGECAQLCESNGIRLGKLELLNFYMIAGGVPYYWTLLKQGMSLVQNVDSLCFTKGGEMATEFYRLYSSLFKKPDNYLKIISTLATKKVGMTRDEIAEETGLGQSGVLTRMLTELELCDFVRKYNMFGNKSKGAMYQLIDSYTLFYYKFIDGNRNNANYWSKIQGHPVYNTWCGLAFERVCLLHSEQIKKALGISGVLTNDSAWYVRAEKSPMMMGTQIDMVIDRQDGVINLCEMKYSTSDYVVDAKTEKALRDKVSNFSITTKSRKAHRITLVTTFGVVRNVHSGVVDNVVGMEDLMG